MLLGELLVQQKVVTPAQIEEALAAQVIHGGRLGTNLVELGHLTEEQLAKALGQQHGIQYAFGAQLAPQPDALALLDTNYADDKDVLPLWVEGNRLYLAVLDPGDIATHDHVAAVTGKRVLPVIVAEFRMAQLQRRYCKAFRPVRAVDLDDVRRKKQALAPKKEEVHEDLMGEEEFANLYAAALSGGATERLVVPSQPAHAVAQAEEELPEAIIVGEAIDEPELIIDVLDVLVEEPEVAPAAAGAPPVVPPTPPRSTPRHPVYAEVTEPLSFEEAQKALAAIHARDDIARTVLRFAIGRFARAMLLTVQGELAIGWQGAGKGLHAGIVQRIGISLAKPSMFKLVKESRSHFIGPLRKDPATISFIKQLGVRGIPRTAVLMPILARGQVVNLLYADNGPGEYASPDVGELLILAQRVGRSYEEMIAARRPPSPVRERLPPPV